jgi:predicted GTPase
LTYRRRISRLQSRRSTPQSPVVRCECGVNPFSTIALSLIAHTNVGKTTLARTLVGRDVGSVRDAQHVTQEATPYPLLTTAEGDTLVVWDTPGFGDSARLARRLAQQGNPIGWFLSQAWDRFRDRAFYLSQQVVSNVRIRRMSCPISSTRRSRPRTQATLHRSSQSSSGSESRWSC